MKSKTKKATRTGKGVTAHSTHPRERVIRADSGAKVESHEPKAVCRHCGGMLRREPDGAVCVMCGRGEEHKCDMCMHREMNAA
ncbi:MAG: hypothetical protein HQK86_03040 [Nitrospinae bacterium]|nr:hypothetical protein [Nitrospinota bacterium]MBF0633427.1 hypothetical protein [Nitrospinota bacterium]